MERLAMERSRNSCVCCKSNKMVILIIWNYILSEIRVCHGKLADLVDTSRDTFYWNKIFFLYGDRWFAKRFLHPDIVAEYDYIFLWDEDLGVENFDPKRLAWLELAESKLDIVVVVTVKTQVWHYSVVSWNFGGQMIFALAQYVCNHVCHHVVITL